MTINQQPSGEISGTRPFRLIPGTQPSHSAKTPAKTLSSLKSAAASLHFLGQGGMGQVHLGMFEVGRPPIVIKSIDPLANPEEQCFNQEALAQEGTMLWFTGEHPNIVGYEGRTDKELYMEYVPGQTAAAQLASAKNGRLDTHTAVKIAIDAARGLQHLHELGIVHRDIKTNNLMTQYDKNRTTKIIDFGLAAVFEESADPNGIAYGTPAYMSPEQAKAQILDGRSDIFSLGITLLEMLTGVNPFLKNNHLNSMLSIKNEEIPAQLIHRLPRKLQNILSKMLAKDPAVRYQSCDDLVRDLEDFSARPYSCLQDYLDLVVSHLAEGFQCVKGFVTHLKRKLQGQN